MHPDYINHPGHADHDPNLDIHFKSMNPNPNRMSGGMNTGAVNMALPSLDAELERLRAIIEQEDDVTRCHQLHRLTEGGFLYLIETPYDFPKFVVGRTDSENNSPQILIGTGAKWSAEQEFELRKLG